MIIFTVLNDLLLRKLVFSIKITSCLRKKVQFKNSESSQVNLTKLNN